MPAFSRVIDRPHLPALGCSKLTAFSIPMSLNDIGIENAHGDSESNR